MSKSVLFSAALVLVLSACGHSGYKTRQIADLKLPKAKVIEGVVSEYKGGDFVLTDASGKIEVDIDLPKGKKLALKNGETVKVYGNLDEDGNDEFDAYAVEKADGTLVTLVKGFKPRKSCGAWAKTEASSAPKRNWAAPVAE